jgi:hypothetical protein
MIGSAVVGQVNPLAMMEITTPLRAATTPQFYLNITID